MRILRTELLRSSLLWVTLPVAAAWIWLTFSRSNMWLGSWPAASTNVTAPAAYAAIVLGALVGLDAARRRLGQPTAALRMSRRGWMGPAAQLAAGVLLALVPMVIAMAAVTIWNARTAPPGHLWVSYVLFAAAVLVTALCASHLIGYAAPSVAIAALAGAATGFIATAYAEVPLYGPPHLEVSPARLVLACVLAVVALFAAVLVPARAAASTRAPGGTRWRATSAGAAAALAAAVIAVPMFSSSVQVPRPAPAVASCTEGSPAVCVWPEHAAYLPDLEPLASRVAETADGLLPLPDRFVEQGVAEPPAVVSTFDWIAPGAGLWHVTEGMVNVVLNTASVQRACLPTTDAGWEHRRALTGQLQYWMTAKAYGDQRPNAYHGQFDDFSQAQDALTLDEESQRAWAANIIAQMDDIPCAAEEPVS
ncbi:hypothetical protein DNL40_00650 [Xylanimonas oleitrophica]|uniref:Uncharacterized protein n=1 Tax=Xylanimonas oleitrophica TaxID=2607479 RepID=A0A2W5WWD0_9MICO|nr:hypothetical protein [Xylanimonas oleitrophica]PZR54942.1 hypothetical protein DNL40_00650 [Xylanimonas oleitrophica]